MADIALNYVRFKRGTPDAFQNLVSKDSDTLYFIHKPGEITGQLYIGDVLISDNLPDNGDAIAAKLAELEDVNVAGVINGQVLGYDAESEKWIPMTINEAIEVSVMTGASEDMAGQAGLVPAPAAGDHNKFLRGDGSWVAMPELSGLKYKKVNSKDEIDVTASDAADYIYLIPVEDGTHEEYLVIDGVIEMLGSLTASLEDYVKNEDLQTLESNVQNLANSLGAIDTKVINMETLLNNKVNLVDYNNKMTSIDSEIAALKQSTSWGTL